jgi:RHS repeat-associated protein
VRHQWLRVAAFVAGSVVGLAPLAPGQPGEPSQPNANAVWIAESAGILKVATAGGSLLLQVPGLADVRAVAVDHQRFTLWAYAAQTLHAYGFDGAHQLAVPLPLPTPADCSLAVNEDDGSVWLAAGQSLASVSAAGQVLHSLRVGANVNSLAVDGGRATLWVGTGTAVSAYDALSGALLRSLPLGSRPAVQDLDLDPQGRVWVALAETVQRFSQDGILLLSIATASPLRVAGDTQGGVWVASAKSLYHFDPSGQATASASPFGGEGTIQELVVDPSNDQAWLANAGSVAHVDASGHVIRVFTVEPGVRIWDLALYADTVPPVVTITAPANGLLTNQRQQTVTGSVSEQATVSANGVTVLLSPDLTFSQSLTLPEGPSVILVVATDRAGNQGQASLQVTLDSIAPAAVDAQRVTLTPPSAGVGTVTASPGSAEPGAAVLMLDLETGATASTSVAADGSFSSPIACRTGDTIRIVLRDAAGNSSTPTAVIVPGAPDDGLPPNPSTVATPLAPAVFTDIASATAFLYTGTNPIQQGVQPGAIDPFIVAVLRGSVHARSGQPIPGVTVTVLGHPDLGSTLTRNDGFFDLAANGGGVVTVQLAKAGFLPAQRQVHAPWRDSVWVDDVVLIEPDSAATEVDPSLTTLQVIRGTAVEDQDGRRQATLLYPAGTSAQLVFPNGQTHPLFWLTVRATEYTAGASGRQAMPAPLPPASGYTYCVELSVDEAMGTNGTVHFSQAVPFYLENFLHFPVGAIVPNGFYDRALAAWVADDNGRVVKIVAVSNGLAELDVTGSGLAANPEDLAALGVTDDERRSLAALYPIGQSLWRVPIQHFSPRDLNWPNAPPPDAEGPPNPDADQPGPDPEPERQDDDNPDRDLDDPCKVPQSSVIECENQALEEDVPIVGTPFSLHYHSGRVAGRRIARMLRVRLSGSRVPASLKRIDLKVTIAGRKFEQSFPPAPGLFSTFEWDGVDAYGRALQGKHLATATVSYVYDAIYLQGASTTRAFAELSPAPSVSFNPAGRGEFSFSLSFTKLLGLMDSSAEKLGGWTLDVLHVYDAEERVLWRGDGTRQGATAIGTSSLQVFGVPGLPGQHLRLAADGSVDLIAVGAAANADIDHFDRNGNQRLLYSNASERLFPYGVARDRLNQVYFLTCDFNRTRSEIRRPSPRSAFTSELVFAVPQVGCGSPHDFVADDAGGFYIAAGSVFHVNADGSVAKVVDASEVQDLSAWSLALAPDGTLFVGDVSGSRVYRLGPSGMLTVFAGNGTYGFSGDGGPAVFAQLAFPSGLSLGRDGSLWVTADRLRRIDASGTIRTVSGGGFNTPSAGMSPFDVTMRNRAAVDPNGTVYFLSGDSGGAVWRIADPFPGYARNSFVVASADGSEVYEFSAQGRHLRTRDALTGAVVYSFAYSSANLLTGITDRAGRLTQIERDAQGNASAIVGPDGQRTTLTIGANGFLAAATNPASEATSFGYASGGLLTSRTDPRGHSSTYRYSPKGRLLSDGDAAGGSKSLQRLAAPASTSVTMTTAEGVTSQYAVQVPPAGGRLRLTTGADGLVSRSQIAPNGQRTVTGSDGSTSTATLGPDPRFGLQTPVTQSLQTRTPAGLALNVTSSRTASYFSGDAPSFPSVLQDTVRINGRQYTGTWNRSQRRHTLTTPTGRRRILDLDTLGRPVALQIGNLAPVTLTYDTAGRPSQIIQGTGADQRVLTFHYDTSGWLSSLTDPQSRTFGFASDAAGRLTRQTLPDSQTIDFSYDPNGNVSTLTPPGRPAHGFGYTAVDLPQTYQPPALGGGPVDTAWTYDRDRRLTQVRRPDGKTVTLGFDGAGRFSTLNFSRGQITATYFSQTGQLAALSAPGGETLTYTYDGSLPIRATWSGPVAGNLTRAYDNDFHLIAEAVNGTGITNQYDLDGLLVRAGDLTITRDAQSGLVTGTALGTVTTTDAYNLFGEPVHQEAKVGGTPFLATDFTRDTLGRITRKTETLGGSTDVWDYSYDTAGRLRVADRNGALVAQYAYDANGNRITVTTPTATTTASYDVQDRLLTHGDLTFTYTANGELATKSQNGQTIQYQYDELGNLVSVLLPDGIHIDYVIDGGNRRIGKKINGEFVQGFLYRNQLQPIAELDGSGNIVARFVYGIRPNTPDYLVKNGSTYRIVADHLGSPRMVIDTSSGEVVQRMDFDAFGKVVLDTNAGFQPFGFAGGLYDRQTDLVRFGARDYDSGVGRWLLRDPLSFNGGDSSLYSYIHSDPVNLTDPSGSAPKDKWYGFYDRRFQDWLHKDKGPDGRGRRDYEKDELEDKYDEWVELGKPDPRQHKGRNKPGEDSPSEFCGRPQGMSMPNIMDFFTKIAAKPPNPCVLAFGIGGATLGGFSGSIVPGPGNVAGAAGGFSLGSAVGGAVAGLLGGYLGCN